MSSCSRTVQWVVWGFLALVIVAISVAFVATRPVASGLPVFQQVGGFSLTNQHGQTVTGEALRGHVWVANVIFTRCGGPCAKLTREMRQVQEAFPATTPLKFVSFTADSSFDTPEVLRLYGNRFQADQQRWSFLTGPKSDLYEFAIKELKFTVIDNEQERKPDEDQFIHSTKFVVLDRAGRARAYVDGTEPTTVPELIRIVSALLKEKHP